jgi:hypothetical protein
MALTDPQPTPGTVAYEQWVARQNADLIAYRREYEAVMRQQGITVTWSTQEAVTGPYSLIDPGNATLSRDGISHDVAITRGRAQTANPQELANFDIQFGLKYKGQALPGEALPSPWFAPAVTPPFFGPQSTVSAPLATSPSQPPTVAAPATAQPAQAPKTPDSGTVVSPPSASGAIPVNDRLNFDQWNWFVEQATGRKGPDPLQYNIDRTRLISWPEYVELLKRAGVPVPTVGDGGTVTPKPLPKPSPEDSDKPTAPPANLPKDDKTALFLIGGAVILLLLARR